LTIEKIFASIFKNKISQIFFSFSGNDEVYQFLKRIRIRSWDFTIKFLSELEDSTGKGGTNNVTKKQFT
jgi:hypothetical protein